MANDTRSQAHDLVSNVRMGAVEEGATFEYLLGLRDYVAAWLAELDAEISNKVYLEGFRSFPGCAVAENGGGWTGEGRGEAVTEEDVSAGLGWLAREDGTGQVGPVGDEAREDLGAMLDVPSEEQVRVGDEVPSGELLVSPVLEHEVGVPEDGGAGEVDQYEVVLEVGALAHTTEAAALVVGEMDARESSGQVNTRGLPEKEWPSGMEPSSSGLGWVSRTPTPVMVAAERVCEMAAGRSASLVEMGRAYRSLVRGQ